MFELKTYSQTVFFVLPCISKMRPPSIYIDFFRPTSGQFNEVLNILLSKNVNIIGARPELMPPPLRTRARSEGFFLGGGVFRDSLLSSCLHEHD